MPNVVSTANAVALPERVPPICILLGTAEHFQVPVEGLTSPDRHPPLVYRRYVGVWVAQAAGGSQQAIAQAFGYDRATVRHGIARIETLRGEAAVEQDIAGVRIATLKVVRGKSVRVRVADVIRAAAQHFGVSREDLLRSHDADAVEHARHVMIAVAKDTRHTPYQIARHLQRDFKSVQASIEASAKRRGEPAFAQEILAVRCRAFAAALEFAKSFSGAARHG